MPTGKNAVLQSRTAEMQFAMARVIAECHADGMRDGIHHAAEKVAAVVDSIKAVGGPTMIPVEEVIAMVEGIAEVLNTSAHEVSAHEPNPSDFGVGTISRETIKQQIRSFLDGE